MDLEEVLIVNALLEDEVSEICQMGNKNVSLKMLI
jgi:hypothetical protein